MNKIFSIIITFLVLLSSWEVVASDHWWNSTNFGTSIGNDPPNKLSGGSGSFGFGFNDFFDLTISSASGFLISNNKTELSEDDDSGSVGYEIFGIGPPRDIEEGDFYSLSRVDAREQLVTKLREHSFQIASVSTENFSCWARSLWGAIIVRLVNENDLALLGVLQGSLNDENEFDYEQNKFTRYIPDQYKITKEFKDYLLDVLEIVNKVNNLDDAFDIYNDYDKELTAYFRCLAAYLLAQNLDQDGFMAAYIQAYGDFEPGDNDVAETYLIRLLKGNDWQNAAMGSLALEGHHLANYFGIEVALMDINPEVFANNGNEWKYSFFGNNDYKVYSLLGDDVPSVILAYQGAHYSLLIRTPKGSESNEGGVQQRKKRKFDDASGADIKVAKKQKQEEVK